MTTWPKYILRLGCVTDSQVFRCIAHCNDFHKYDGKTPSSFSACDIMHGALDALLLPYSLKQTYFHGEYCLCMSASGMQRGKRTLLDL